MRAMTAIDPKAVQARLVAGESKRAIARSLGVAPSTVRRAAVTRTAITPAKAIRTPVKAPTRHDGIYAWDLGRIRRARDEQMRGCFELPVRMAEAMRTDDALFTAYQARVATQIAVALAWVAADSAIGQVICDRARGLIHLPQVIRQSILGTMANHGIAIGYAPPSAVDTPEGPTLTMTLTEWPLEHVRWDRGRCELMTRVKDGEDVAITHGVNGWVVFRKFGVSPWTQDAALLAASLLWPAHAGSISDWAGASYAHGQPKLVGELPEGVRLEKDDGTGDLTAETSAMLETLATLASGDAGAGIIPAGAKATMLESGSTAWQVFDKLATNRESAAARIYLGTDAILGSRGGAPGIDIGALFGIATTRIQGDLEALERGFREGMIEPWIKAHGYQLSNAPRAVYELPDVDADARSEQESAAIERLEKSVTSLRSIGAEVTQSVVDALRATLGVSVPAKLMDPATTPAPAPESAPTARRRHVRAEPVDADGDGQVNEEEAAEAIVDDVGPVDADGDGKINEEEKESAEVKAARKKVAKALAKHEAKREKKAALQKTADDARAKRDALSNEDQINDAIFAGAAPPEPAGRLEDAAAARDAAERTHDDALETRDGAQEDLDEVNASTPAEMSETRWQDNDGNPINGHEAKLQLEREIPEHEAAVAAADAERKRTKNEHIKLAKEHKKAGKDADRALNKLDEFDDGTEDLQESIGDYEQASVHALNEAEEARDQARYDLDEDPGNPELQAALEHHEKRYAAKEAAHEEHMKAAGIHEAIGASADTETDPQKVRDSANAIITGPKGGQYYLGPSGEPVYVK